MPAYRIGGGFRLREPKIKGQGRIIPCTAKGQFVIAQVAVGGGNALEYACTLSGNRAARSLPLSILFMLCSGFIRVGFVAAPQGGATVIHQFISRAAAPPCTKSAQRSKAFCARVCPVPPRYRDFILSSSVLNGRTFW